MKSQSVEPSKLIPIIAEEFKKIEELRPPEWAQFVKTGVHKERPPVQKNWWHIRSAAVLLSVAKLGPIGVSKLRTKYGGKRHRGYRPEHFFKGSGSIIRKILQQLESAALIEKTRKGVHKGRSLTKKGKQLLDSAAEKSAVQQK